MNIRTRRIFFLSFVSIFIVAAIWMIASTVGYRFEIKSGRFIATGRLVITPTPKDAKVSVNGKPTTDRFPIQLPDISPGFYTIEVSKEGYFPWKKTVEVKNQRTTFVNDIVLFTNELPTLLHPADQWIPFISSPDTSSVAYGLEKGGTTEWWLHPFTTQEDRLISRTKKTGKIEASWSPKGNALLLFTPSTASASSTSQARIIPKDPLANTLSIPIDNQTNGIRWFTNGENTLLKKNTVGQIFQMNLPHFIEIPYGKLPEHTDWIVIDEKIYAIERRAGRFYVSYFNPDSQSLNTIQEIEYSSTTPPSFLSTSAPFLTLIYPNQSLLVIDLITESPSPLFTAHGTADEWGTRNHAGKLLYHTEFELWMYNHATRATTLLNRYSAPIRNALFLPGTEYVAVNVDGTISIFELDTRDIINTYPLPVGTNIEFFTVDDKSTTLLLFGTIGNQKGVFELRIQL